MTLIPDAIAIPMLTAAVALNSVSEPVPLGNARKHTHGVVFGAGTTAGTVIVETAADRNFTGLWEPLATYAWAGAAPNQGGTEDSYEGPLIGFVRHRVSVAIAGGSVTTTMRRLLVK